MTSALKQICPASALSNGGAAVRFCVRVGGELQPAFVFRYTDRIYAYRNVCAHRGVELDWQPGEFFDVERRFLICATHGARYEPTTGQCVGGPCAGAGLSALSVREQRGAVFLVTGNGIDFCADDQHRT